MSVERLVKIHGPPLFPKKVKRLTDFSKAMEALSIRASESLKIRRI